MCIHRTSRSSMAWVAFCHTSFRASSYYTHTNNLKLTYSNKKANHDHNLGCYSGTKLQWNPALQTLLKYGHPLYCGHCTWPQTYPYVYKTTPEIRTPPNQDTLSGSQWALGGFHCSTSFSKAQGVAYWSSIDSRTDSNLLPTPVVHAHDRGPIVEQVSLRSWSCYLHTKDYVPYSVLTLSLSKCKTKNMLFLSTIVRLLVWGVGKSSACLDSRGGEYRLYILLVICRYSILSSIQRASSLSIRCSIATPHPYLLNASNKHRQSPEEHHFKLW